MENVHSMRSLTNAPHQTIVECFVSVRRICCSFGDLTNLQILSILFSQSFSPQFLWTSERERSKVLSSNAADAYVLAVLIKCHGNGWRGLDFFVSMTTVIWTSHHWQHVSKIKSSQFNQKLSIDAWKIHKCCVLVLLRCSLLVSWEWAWREKRQKRPCSACYICSQLEQGST